MALGAHTSGQPPASGGTVPTPSHGRRVLALRPACASCMPATPPCACTKSTMRRRQGMCPPARRAACFGRRGPDALPRPARAGLAARVRELHACAPALRVHEIHNALEEWDVPVIPDAKILGTDAAGWLDGGRLRHHQAGATGREAAEVHEVPVVGEAILTRVLAHWRNGDTVSQRDIPKSKTRKQRCHYIAPAAW